MVNQVKLMCPLLVDIARWVIRLVIFLQIKRQREINWEACALFRYVDRYS
jgi:hypothetical protein